MTAAARRGVRNVALAAIAFAVTSAALRSLVPLPDTLGLRAKLEAFAAVKDEIDAVYIGSSRFRRAFRPDVVDPIVTKRLGRPFHSFNLGIAALGSYEQNEVIQRVIDMRPARLRTVVVEAPTLFPTTARRFNMASERALYWHTVPNTVRSIASLLDAPDVPPARKLELALVHVRMMVQRAASWGLGPRMVGGLLERDPSGVRESRDALMRNAGFEIERSGENPRWTAQRRAFEAVADAYAADIARWQADPPAQGSEPPARVIDVRAMRDQQRRIAEAGLDSVLVVPPLFLPLVPMRSLARTGVLADAIDLARPEDYPDLYALDSRWDREHLSDRGARRASRRLAPQLADRIDARDRMP